MLILLEGEWVFPSSVWVPFVGTQAHVSVNDKDRFCHYLNAHDCSTSDAILLATELLFWLVASQMSWYRNLIAWQSHKGEEYIRKEG
jgi:hypothetical protein